MITRADAVVFDVETYRNFFLVLFKHVATGKVTHVQMSPNRRLNHSLLLDTLESSLLIGFNSIDYDVPMIQCALKGYDTYQLKEASDDIIRGMQFRDFCEKHELSKPSWNHIDLISVAPLKAGLKLYAGRLHCKKLQDLPIDPDKLLTAEEAAQIVEYCGNDLVNTETLYQELDAQIALREELSRVYKQDLRSRSDAQVAEQVISNEVQKINGVRPKRPTGLEGSSFKYQVPDYVSYRTPELKSLLEKIRKADFVINANGSVETPQPLNGLDVRVGVAKYRVGLGGLHSSETKSQHIADDEYLLIDRDVASFYPRIILNQGLYPKHLGAAFLEVYNKLVVRRLTAKKAGDKTTAESLKIAINGGFGKLGSKWSVLYAPDLLIQVTITGQLVLLMLIEMIEEFGIRVLSANTDGILIKCPKAQYDDLNAIIQKWESITAFETEETQYRAVYSKDVNNYLAIKTDGKAKGKGLYTCPWNGITEGPPVFKLQKNPSTTIVIEAVINLLRDGAPLTTTIRNCKDIRKFTAVRTVTGGANVNGVYLGKVVRWIYATGDKQILNYKKSGNKVAKTDNSKPMMELPDEFPKNINYDWYVLEARAVLNSIGYLQQTLFGS